MGEKMRAKVKIDFAKSEIEKLYKYIYQVKPNLDLNYVAYKSFDLIVRGDDREDLIELARQVYASRGIVVSEQAIKRDVNSMINEGVLDYILRVNIDDEKMTIKCGSLIAYDDGNVDDESIYRYLFEVKNEGVMLENGIIPKLDYTVTVLRRPEEINSVSLQEGLGILAEDSVKQIFTTLLVLNGEMSNFIEKEESTGIKVIHNNKKKTKKGKIKKNPIYIKCTKLKLKMLSENDIKDLAKRSYGRRSLNWIVRGHWRNYKNGNRVWINSQVRGAAKRSEEDIVQEYVIKA